MSDPFKNFIEVEREVFGDDMEGFDRFLDDYKKALAVERAAVENVG